jgi:restriction endonuclease S subunit
MELPLPPLAEQQRIVTSIGTAFAVLERIAENLN